jgi:hypothetical protein
MILPLCILPFISETIIHIRTSPAKKGACEEPYAFRPAGFVAAMVRKDIVSMAISVNSVIDLNLRLSIRVRLWSLFLPVK